MSVMASTTIEKQVFLPSAIQEKVNFGDQVYLAHNGRHTNTKAEKEEKKKDKIANCCRCQRSDYKKCVRGKLSFVKLPQDAIDAGCQLEYDLCIKCAQAVLLKSSHLESRQNRDDKSTGKVVKIGYAAKASASFIDFRTGSRAQPKIYFNSATKLNWKLPPLILNDQHLPKPFSLSQSTLSSLP